MPSTSQATVAKFLEIYQRLLDQDYQILTILVSSKLSGTVNSAVQAKAMLPADAPIEIIDSNSTAMAMGFHLLTVARAIKQGATLPRSVALAQKASGHDGALFCRRYAGVPASGWAHRGSITLFGNTAEFQTHPGAARWQGGRQLNVCAHAGKVTRPGSSSWQRRQIGGRTPVRLASLHANAPEDAQIVLEEAIRAAQPGRDLFFRSQPGDWSQCWPWGGGAGVHGRDVSIHSNNRTAVKSRRGLFRYLQGIKVEALK